MSLILDENSAKHQIRAYQPGQIKVNEKIYYHSLIVTSQKLIDWTPQTFTELTAEHLNILASLAPPILLIGTGSALKFLSPTVYGKLINQGIGVEVMTTRAACMTYNALTAENREVAAALIIK